MNKNIVYYQSPVGILEIMGNKNGITSIQFVDDIIEDFEIPICLQNCVTQLDEYFKGKRKEFSINLDLEGTGFQKRVWRELQKIPYGKTVSYLNIAMVLGDKKLSRAVGRANGKNKISIIVPCHRVIGRNGELTGYTGGLFRKQWLIDFEKEKM